MKEIRSGHNSEKILTVLKWVFAGLFIIAALFGESSFLSSVAFLVAGLLIFPPLQEIWRIKLPFLRNRAYKGIIFFGLLVIAGIGLPAIKNENVLENKKGSLPKNTDKEVLSEETDLKEVTSYYVNPYTKSGYENIRTYYFGLYIDLPTDTTGVAGEIMTFLKEKTMYVNEDDAIHLWVFSDSTVIPNSFEGEWSTPKMRENCFAHAAKLSTGKLIYNDDIFSSYK